MELILEEGKIHRILLNSPAICKLSYVESPNCIWFKLVNNVSDDLRVVGSALLERLHVKVKSAKQTLDNNVDNNNCIHHQQENRNIQTEKFQYVLAPLREKLYARARIVHVKHLKCLKREYEFAYVHFIDEGYGAWMNTKCLAKMPINLYEHPWQAFPIALFKIRSMVDGSSFCDWPKGLTDALIELMAEYEYFKVVPVIDSRRNPNYYEYTRAEIYGLNSLNDDKDGNAETEGNAESIGHRLPVEYAKNNIIDDTKDGTSSDENDDLPEPMEELIPLTVPLHLDACFDRSLYDAKQQQLIPEQNFHLTKDVLMEIPRWRMKWCIQS